MTSAVVTLINGVVVNFGDNEDSMIAEMTRNEMGIDIRTVNGKQWFFPYAGLGFIVAEEKPNKKAE